MSFGFPFIFFGFFLNAVNCNLLLWLWKTLTPEAFARLRAMPFLLLLRQFESDAGWRVQIIKIFDIFKVTISIVNWTPYCFEGRRLVIDKFCYDVWLMSSSSRSGNLRLQGRLLSFNESLLAITPYLRDLTLRPVLWFDNCLSFATWWLPFVLNFWGKFLSFS